MKININPSKLSGYTNLGLEDLENIDDLVDDAEATEIICFDTLRFLPYDQVGEFLLKLVRKIRIGGTIAISDIDSYELYRHYVYGQIDGKQLNSVLHDQQYPIRSSLTMGSISSFLTDCQLKITKKRINGHTITLEAIRNV